MTDPAHQERAKAAIKWMEREAYRYDLASRSQNVIMEWVELLRPIAAGTHVIVPIEPTVGALRMLGCKSRLGELTKSNEFKTYVAMIAASQEGE